MKKLTEDKVQAIFPAADSHHVEEFTNLFNEYALLFGFEKEVHINFFLAQLKEEVGSSLHPRRENLNYSCKALKQLFSYYKKHPKEAEQDGRCNGHKANQKAIANKVYHKRIGNTVFGHGHRYRGGGYIQLTGLDNYTKASEVITIATGELWTPEDVEHEIDTVKGALLTAMAFWSWNKLWKCENIDCVTAKVNKHTKSYAKRKKHYKYIASL